MNDDTNDASPVDLTPVDPPAHPDTVAITTGRSHAGRALGSVLHASAVWQVDSLEEHRAMASSARADRFYGRYAKPTVTAFEEAVAEIDGKPPGVVFASSHSSFTLVAVSQPQ